MGGRSMLSNHRLTLFVLFFTLMLATTARAEWLREEREAMGTRIAVELWTEDTKAGETAMNAVFTEFDRLDEMMNPWNAASELSRINREAAKGAVTTTPEIVEVIARAAHYSALTRGAFDISFASVGQHYDYREGDKPSEKERANGKANIDYRAITLDEKARTIAYTLPGLQVDLGGIAKGYAVDRGISLLEEAGITAAVVSAGGDSRILGDRGDRARTVGIRHPRKDDEFVVLIPLADTAISTSGDYERFFVEDGVRYHHILDPKTGDSARKVQSVSILAARSIDSDALSTAVFVMGARDGLALVNTLPGIDAIVIDGAGKLHYSRELLRSVDNP